jgi:hypothetical protein
MAHVVARRQEVDDHVIEVIEEPVVRPLPGRGISLVAADQSVRRAILTFRCPCEMGRSRSATVGPDHLGHRLRPSGFGAARDDGASSKSSITLFRAEGTLLLGFLVKASCASQHRQRLREAPDGADPAA